MVLLKTENGHYLLPSLLVKQLLEQSETSGESFCKLLMTGLLRQSDSQYRHTGRDFMNPNSEYGIYFNEEAGQFAVYLSVTPKPWHQNGRVRTAAAAAGVLGALGVGAYIKGAADRHAQQKKKREMTGGSPIAHATAMHTSANDEHAAADTAAINEWGAAWSGLTPPPPEGSHNPYANFYSMILKDVLQGVYKGSKAVMRT
jgi:hypothetical protein